MNVPLRQNDTSNLKWGLGQARQSQKTAYWYRSTVSLALHIRWETFDPLKDQIDLGRVECTNENSNARFLALRKLNVPCQVEYVTNECDLN